MKKLFHILILLFIFSCSKHKDSPENQPNLPEASNTSFVIPIFPDTQEAVTGKMAMFVSQCDWIANKRDSLNIPLALHVGDLVNFDTIPQYQNASNIMKRLDDRNVPYVIAIGNHDTGAVLPNSGSAAPGNVNANLRNTTKFNSFFPISRFKLQKGVFEAGKSDNAFHQFTAGAKKWMVINLEFCARENAVKWADSVISVYPDYNTIVLTHYHLTPTGEINTT
ncbi:MAG: metallophosphoesterase, partial [Sphingobacteriales bacterium]